MKPQDYTRFSQDKLTTKARTRSVDGAKRHPIEKTRKKE